jgi:WASH complex subunit strumpellin
MVGKKEMIDGVPLVIGVVTVLKQFNCEYRNHFVALLAQYVRSVVEQHSFQKTSVLPIEIVNVLNFIEEYIYYSNFERKVSNTFFFTFLLCNK